MNEIKQNHISLHRQFDDTKRMEKFSFPFFTAWFRAEKSSRHAETERKKDITSSPDVLKKYEEDNFFPLEHWD